MIVLLGCVKDKSDAPAAARNLYRSPLWRGRRAYVEASGHPWMILSALHGLVDPEQVLAPYDLALTDVSAAKRREWGVHVVDALGRRFGDLDGMTFEVHAGVAYRKAIEPRLRDRGARVSVPLEGLSLGRQLRWYRDSERHGTTAASH